MYKCGVYVRRKGGIINLQTVSTQISLRRLRRLTSVDTVLILVNLVHGIGLYYRMNRLGFKTESVHDVQVKQIAKFRSFECEYIFTHYAFLSGQFDFRSFFDRN